MELGPFLTTASSTKKLTTTNRESESDSNSEEKLQLEETTAATMGFEGDAPTTGFSELSNNVDRGDGTTAAATNTSATVTTTGATPKPKRISEFDAVQHLIKGNLGPGCLNIPHAFATCGWVMGLFLFGMVALQGIYSMVILVYCKQWLLKDRKERGRIAGTSFASDHQRDILTFMDVAYATHGTPGAVAVQVLLFVLQAGVCCVFLSLIATNLHAALPRLEQELCVGSVTLALLVVVLVRDLKELKWLSLGANCLMVTAILTAAVSGVWVLLGHDNDNDDGQPAVEAKKWTTNPAIIAGFVSSMFYSFEGIGLVMPVENSFVGYHDTDDTVETNATASSASDNDDNETAEETRRAERTRTFLNPVLVGSMSTVAGFFLLIGATCGPAFPDIKEGSVTAYLTTRSPGNLWYQLVNAGVMVAVFFTFPLQLTPAMEVLGEWFGPGCDPACCGSSAATNGWCCLGGGGLRRRTRRRAGPRSGGRHTRVSQGEEDGNEMTAETEGVGNDDDDVFCDEETAADNDDRSDDSRGYGTMAVPSTAAPAMTNGNENSCFGPHEWIFRRFLVVFGCALVVLTVNDLGLLMALFGALGNTGLAAMPCLVHWRLMETGIAPRNFLLMAVDACTICVSLGVAVIGVAFSVQEILEENRR